MIGRPRIITRALAIAFLQYVLILIITLIGSFPVNMDADVNPYGVIAVLAVTSVAGITLGGWIGLRSGWLQGDSLVARIVAATIGVVVVLGLGLALGQVREASPFLTAGMVAGIVGFHAPGWIGARSANR